MKIITSILIFLISIHSFGQKENPENELKKIFYDLPIQKDLEIVIDSAKTKDLITEYKNQNYNSTLAYFSGFINKNDFIKTFSSSGQIEIFRSGGYTLWGQELDSLDIISIYLNYSDKMTKELNKEYKRLIRQFKVLSAKHEKYNLYADPGLVGYGFCFFKKHKDSLPFMSIEIGIGDCVSDSKSLNINYYKIEKQ